MSTESDSKPSVLLINRVFPPDRGTTGRLVRDLSLAFAKDGWHVNVVCASRSKSVERHKNNDIRVHRVKAPITAKTGWQYFKAWCKMAMTARRLPSHDLVISMTDPPLLVVAASMIARRKKSAHIHWCQDVYPDLLPVLGINLPGFFYKILLTLSRRAMNHCDKIVVIGRDMGNYLIREGISPSKISVVPNWPNMELVRPSGGYHRPAGHDDNPQKGTNGKHHYATEIRAMQKGQEPIINLFKDKNNPRFRILYAGSIGLAHPIQTILDSAEILNQSNPEIEFVFVGDGPAFEHLAEERARRNIQNIRLVPFQPTHNLRELMESGDVHLISMTDKSQGLLVPSKLYSALAVARPTIFLGPEQSEVAKVIRDFKAGIVLPQGDPQKLADIIKHYRYDADDWFAAQHGAAEGGQTFVPRQSIIAFLKRSHSVFNATKSKK